jgi:hypothetical protein
MVHTVYNPMPARGAADYDERMDKYDEDFSVVVNDAFIEAAGIILVQVSILHGWQLAGLWENRCRGYLQDWHEGRMPHESYIGRITTAATAQEPSTSYEGHPLSTSLKMHVALSHEIAAFVVSMPEGYAGTIKNMVCHYGFDTRKFGDR